MNNNNNLFNSKKIILSCVGQYRYSQIQSSFNYKDRVIYDLNIKSKLSQKGSETISIPIKRIDILKSFLICLKYIYQNNLIIRNASKLNDAYLIYEYLKNKRLKKFF